MMGESAASSSSAAADSTDVIGRKRQNQHKLIMRTAKRAKAMFEISDTRFMEDVCAEAGLGAEDLFEQNIDDLVKSERGNQQWICIYDRINDFLRSIGDHQSRILLLRRPPKNIPPQNPKSLVYFMRMDVYEGDILDFNGKPLKTTSEKIVQGSGSWRKHSPLKQFKSAISSLHEKRGNGGDWQELCNAGLEEEKKKRKGKMVASVIQDISELRIWETPARVRLLQWSSEIWMNSSAMKQILQKL